MKENTLETMFSNKHNDCIHFVDTYKHVFATSTHPNNNKLTSSAAAKAAADTTAHWINTSMTETAKHTDDCTDDATLDVLIRGRRTLHMSSSFRILLINMMQLVFVKLSLLLIGL